MTKFEGIRIEMGVTISEETVQRCLNLLRMWLEDNPDKTILVDRSQQYGTGEPITCVYIAPVEEGDNT